VGSHCSGVCRLTTGVKYVTPKRRSTVNNNLGDFRARLRAALLRWGWPMWLPYSRIPRCGQFVLLCHLATGGVLHAESKSAPNSVTPHFEVWKLTGPVLATDNEVYLEWSTSKGEKMLFDPVSKKVVPANQLDLSKFKELPPIYPTDRQIPLSNGGSIESNIEAPGAKCGYTVGSSYIYRGSASAASRFYLIRKLPRPTTTHYCGAPLHQVYDSDWLVGAVALSDGRVMVVDGSMEIAIAMTRPPSSVLVLDGIGFLVPGDMLRPALDEAGADQALRYKALLQLLRDSGPVPIRLQPLH
jgi:hypothetical protein